jgi:hypothetical protein
VLFLVLFIDANSTGKHSSFDGVETYLVACCGMTGFASMEPIQHANSKNFASAIMKIQLRYGFCHTIVFDKDSKFNSIYHKALDLLHINCHVLLGDKHNPMLVKRINQYLPKGLKITTSKHNSVLIALKAILHLLYAWNSCPIPDTDIFVALLQMVENLSTILITQQTNIGSLHLPPTAWKKYSQDLGTQLSALCEVAQLLFHCPVR